MQVVGTLSYGWAELTETVTRVTTLLSCLLGAEGNFVANNLFGFYNFYIPRTHTMRRKN